MAGHVQDLWERVVRLDDGRTERVRTSRYGKGKRWQTRYLDPDGVERTKTFDRKVDAERFLTTTAADVLRGSYVDPDAGRKLFRTYAGEWLEAQTFDEATRTAVEVRLRVHAFPVLGAMELGKIKPSTVQAWLRGLERLAASYRSVIYANVSTVLTAAVDDELIVKNPCRAASVTRPRVDPKRVVPWSVDRVVAVHDALPERWRIAATLGAGLGLRQGEVFGLSPDDVDFLRGRVEVRRQVKVDKRNRAYLALPKGRKTRTVPLPATVREELAAYLTCFPAVAVTLPWETIDGELVTVPLVLTGRERNAANRNYVNAHVWKPALLEAKVPTTRENGSHALRHFYASTLLDAGESIKAVSEYLGHADAGFTLRTYTHLMPSSEERTRKAIDAVFGQAADDDAAEVVDDADAEPAER